VIGTVDDVYEYDEETIVRICPYQIQLESDCSKLIKADYEPSLWTWDIGPIDKARIIHILSDYWSNNLPEFKFFLPAGQSVSFECGGGTILTEQPECSGSAWTFFRTILSGKSRSRRIKSILKKKNTVKTQSSSENIVGVFVRNFG
jgi:hypothetical protein